ncbi:MAG: ABC transporter permease [Paracoccaceae bacterium]|nr:ABC transporter permease [Paracoccaceae bacterium]
MTRAVIAALLSYWRRRPGQLATLILGLALATALWSGVQAINAEARKTYDEAANVLAGGGLPSLLSPSGTISKETFIRLRRAGWQVSPVIDGWIATPEGRVRLLGIDPFTAPRDGAFGTATEAGAIDDVLGPDGILIASPATADRLRPAYNVREDPAIAPGLAVADLTVAARLLEQPGYSRLMVLEDQPLIRPPLEEIAPKLILEAPETAEDLGRLTDSFHLNLTAFGLLSFAVGLFIVNGAVGLAFEQRRQTFRTLRALGATARTLVIVLIGELLLFAIIAGLAGIVLGYLIAGYLLPDVAATLRGLYGATMEGSLTLSPVWWLSGVAIAILGTALAAAFGLVQVARMPPLAPAKPRAWAMVSQGTARWQLLAALAFLAAALAALAFGSGLIAGFILLGGFLMAAALALPSALALCLRLAARTSRDVMAEWFWADTRQQLPGLSLALMALLLALSANIGVGTMVASFRTTFTGWLDQRLVSDLYVTVEDKAQEDALRAFLTAEGAEILPIWHTDGDILGAPAEIYGVVDHPVYTENWPLLSSMPDAWDQIARGEGALVNEQLARREGLTPGTALTMPGGWETPIVGVYSDYGNPLGQVVIPWAVLVERYPEADKSDFGVLTDDPQALRAGLIGELGLSEDQMIDQGALKAFSLDVFERTFAVTAALNVLTLSVAGLAILTSLLTLSTIRLPQLAPLWSLGTTRRQLAMIELLRAVTLAIVTFLLAIPVGLGLAWVLLSVINVEAFGWKLPMTVFPADWLWLFLAALAAALLSSLWPALQLARRPPADLIRVFTHER